MPALLLLCEDVVSVLVYPSEVNTVDVSLREVVDSDVDVDVSLLDEDVEVEVELGVSLVLDSGVEVGDGDGVVVGVGVAVGVGVDVGVGDGDGEGEELGVSLGCLLSCSGGPPDPDPLPFSPPSKTTKLAVAPLGTVTTQNAAPPAPSELQPSIWFTWCLEGSIAQGKPLHSPPSQTTFTPHVGILSRNGVAGSK